MSTLFSNTTRSGLYRHLHTRLSPADGNIQKCAQCLQIYLTIVRELATDLDILVALTYSPYLEEVLGKGTIINYGYRLVFNDLDGLGVDDGFLSTGRPPNQRSSGNRILFPLKDVLTLRSLPEDDLGDLTTEVSVFLIRPGHTEDILGAMRSGTTPELERLLKAQELFVHITCSKSPAYFDAMIVYSQTDQEQALSAAISRHALESYL